jgi:broad specificity phosphatase PhoE
MQQRTPGPARWWRLRVLSIYLRVGVSFFRWRLQLLRQPRNGTDATESTRTRMKQTLLFIRHGQTTWNVEHRLPGQLPDVALNATGRQQVERLADALSAIPISALISSPLERAYDTAEILAQGRNLAIEREPDLMDTNVGRWAGKIIEDIAKNDPDWKAYVRNPTVAPEGVETFPQVQQRAVAAVERWRAQEQAGAYPAFVAHADVIKLLLAHYTGLEAGRAGSLAIDNASVSIVQLEEEHPPRVVAISWNPRPGWLNPLLTDRLKSKSDLGQQEQQSVQGV